MLKNEWGIRRFDGWGALVKARWCDDGGGGDNVGVVVWCTVAVMEWKMEKKRWERGDGEILSLGGPEHACGGGHHGCSGRKPFRRGAGSVHRVL